MCLCLCICACICLCLCICVEFRRQEHVARCFGLALRCSASLAFDLEIQRVWISWIWNSGTVSTRTDPPVSAMLVFLPDTCNAISASGTWERSSGENAKPELRESLVMPWTLNIKCSPGKKRRCLTAFQTSSQTSRPGLVVRTSREG